MQTVICCNEVVLLISSKMAEPYTENALKRLNQRPNIYDDNVEILLHWNILSLRSVM